MPLLGTSLRLKGSRILPLLGTSGLLGVFGVLLFGVVVVLGLLLLLFGFCLVVVAWGLFLLWLGVCCCFSGLGFVVVFLAWGLLLFFSPCGGRVGGPFFVLQSVLDPRVTCSSYKAFPDR